MTEQEGVIKYHLDFKPAKVYHHPEYAELNAWRTLLFKLELIGQDPGRYAGLGFGNLSFRLGLSGQFVITASQTGGLEHLTDNHFCTIVAADPLNNRISAEGVIKPSSEALTHAALYLADKRIKAVVHVHSPLIWRHHQALGLAVITESIPYGTPEMAKAVMMLWTRNTVLPQPVIAMLGHEDGIISFGESITEASLVLIKTLAAAMQIASQE